MLLKNYDTNARLCMECKEAIFNPLCPSCITREINSWLQQYPKVKKKINGRVDDFVNKNKFLKNKGEKCVVCRRDSVFLCPYCFTEFVLSELKKLKISRSLVREFLQLFNFDFEHTGYYKEAEKLGVF